MEKYLISVAMLSISVTALRAVLPIGSGALRQAVSFILALVLLVFIISPIKKLPFFVSSFGSFCSGGDDTDRYGYVWNNKTAEVIEGELCKYISDVVSEEFNTECEVISKLSVTDKNEIIVDSIEVYVSAVSLVNPRSIESRVSELVGEPCIVKEVG